MGIDYSHDKEKFSKRYSTWAILSISSALLPWLLLALFRPASLWLLRLFYVVPWSLASVSGIIALVRMRRRDSSLHGKLLAIAGMLIPAGYVAFLFVSGYNLSRLIYQPMEEIRNCQDNMAKLYSMLRNYADSHGGLLPEGADWCDELSAQMNLDTSVLACPNADVTLGRSTYALNEHVAAKSLADIPGETVLLFECAPGWNRTGDAALVTSSNHSLARVQYVNVLMANGRTVHCRKDKVTQLRWLP